jgi:hypothetical protein
MHPELVGNRLALARYRIHGDVSARSGMKILIAGFSQGGHVVGDTTENLTKANDSAVSHGVRKLGTVPLRAPRLKARDTRLPAKRVPRARRGLRGGSSKPCFDHHFAVRVVSGGVKAAERRGVSHGEERGVPSHR